MAMAGLYRRSLPSPPAIDFASSEGKVSYSLLLFQFLNFKIFFFSKFMILMNLSTKGYFWV